MASKGRDRIVGGGWPSGPTIIFSASLVVEVFLLLDSIIGQLREQYHVSEQFQFFALSPKD